MIDKKDSHSVRRVPFRKVSMGEDELTSGREWHLQFAYDPEFLYPIPIAPMRSRNKHEPVGHLSSDGKVHGFKGGIIEQLVRATVASMQADALDPSAPSRRRAPAPSKA